MPSTPPTVIADIEHPSAHENVTKMPTDLIAQYDVVRVFLVKGLTDGSTNQTATFLDRALSAKGVPQLGTLAPGTAGAAGAIAVNKSTAQAPSTDDCYVLVTYKNPMPGAPVAFIVSDDTSLTSESCQLHPRDKSPMMFTYKPPVQLARPPRNAPIFVPGGGMHMDDSQYYTEDPPAKPEQYQATFRYSRPIRKVVLQGYVINRDLDQFRNCIGGVNDDDWLRYPPGFWRFDDFRNDGILFGNIIKITCGLTSRVTENWMQWEVFNSPDLGRRVTVKASDVAALKRLGYFYDWKALNGIIVAGLHPAYNFVRIFGFGGGPGQPGGVPDAPTPLPPINFNIQGGFSA